MTDRPMKSQRLLQDGLLQRGVSQTRNRTALIVDGRPYAFGDLLEASQRLAGALRNRAAPCDARIRFFVRGNATGRALSQSPQRRDHA